MNWQISKKFYLKSQTIKQSNSDFYTLVPTTYKIVILSLMLSLALVLSIVESWIPIPLMFPGVKLGLANIITMITLILFGYRSAALIVCIRCLIVGIFYGGPVVFLFSIIGGISSVSVMAVLIKRFQKYFSIIAISLIGAVMHNVGQILVAGVIIREFGVVIYLPILIVSGVIMGVIVGFLSNSLIKFFYRDKCMENRADTQVRPYGR